MAESPVPPTAPATVLRQETVLESPLARRLGTNPQSQQVAAALVAVWRDIDAALDPIMGARGVDALCQRSLQLGSAQHAWLALGMAAPVGSLDEARLQTLIASHPCAEAIAAGNAFLIAFRQLLASLIGQALTDRLLEPAWAGAPSESVATAAAPAASPALGTSGA